MNCSFLRSTPRRKYKPCKLGAEMPTDGQTFVVVDVVKSSAMNKPRKRPMFLKNEMENEA